jgi:catechol 2,3-dioxygenase-like lactoylglutathione lyase family enzyme
MATFVRAVHSACTVCNMEDSARWYQRVLGFKFVKRFDVSPGEPGISRILLLHPDSGFLLGIYDHPQKSGDRFVPSRTGMDHLAFEVSDDLALVEWLEELDRLGVEHSPIRDLGHAKFISIEDPDGIQIELWHTLVPHRPAEAQHT